MQMRWTVNSVKDLGVWALLTVGLLLIGELGARAMYFIRHDYDVAYLITPWDTGGRRPPLTQVVHEGERGGAEETPVGGGVTLRVNRQGGRGSDWAMERPRGALRILAIGGSSTFGVYNREEMAWPALLERELRHRDGRPVEVLNGGRPGAALGSRSWAGKDKDNDLLHALWNPRQPEASWLLYRPDVVLYYGGLNNTPSPARASETIGRFHEMSRFGQRTAPFYYRSMLYTYIVEKYFFRRYMAAIPIFRELQRFRGNVRQLIQLVRAHEAVPIVVLQVLEEAVDPTVKALDLEDERAVVAFTKLPLTSAHDYSARNRRELALRSHLFIEAVRREGAAAGVQVLDPRPAFEASRDPASLFYDIVHLTDAGNQLLARQIAEQLEL